MTKKILYVDDDTVMHTMVTKCLGSEFNVICKTTISEGLESMKNDTFDLVLIDRLLPDGDGISLCHSFREEDRFASLPIVFISGKSTESDKVSSLFAGGDDYITKPFSPLELKARIMARLRQFKSCLRLGSLEIEPDRHKLFYVSSSDQKKEISVTPLEYKLLLTLISQPDIVFTREHLLNKLWGQKLNVTDRVVDTHISHLRQKIKESNVQIEAIAKEGYRIKIA